MLIERFQSKYSNNGIVKIKKELADYLGDYAIITLGPDNSLAMYNEIEFKNICSRLRHGDECAKALWVNLMDFSSIMYVSQQKIKIPSDLAKDSGFNPLSKVYISVLGKYIRIGTKEYWDSARIKSYIKESNQAKMDEEKEILNRVESLKKEIFYYIEKKDYRSYERILAEIYNAKIEGLVELLPYSKDGGVDFVINILNGDDVTPIYVQCKASKRKITVNDVRELIGVVARDSASAGILIATNGYTGQAHFEASVSKIRVRLDDVKTIFETNYFDTFHCDDKHFM